MRIVISVGALAMTALATSAGAAEPATGCASGEQPIRRIQNWSDKSDAVCSYGFIEANQRLAGLIEAPRGTVGVEWLKHTLGIPRFIQREGYEPNQFFVVNAGYQVALTGPDGWEMVIEAYDRRREGAWGRKADFQVKFHATGLSPEVEAASKGRCLTEASVLDRALAAGWRYVPGGMVSGTAGPLFAPGALVTDDGRSLVLVNLSRTSELPARDKLESTCAWIFSFGEHNETRTAPK
ncbi:MAG: hypothetical protein Q7T68_03825 [Sphingopyxis sp.]|nr:hypothetical protein [Sphingopyxis sp.]